MVRIHCKTSQISLEIDDFSVLGYRREWGQAVHRFHSNTVPRHPRTLNHSIKTSTTILTTLPQLDSRSKSSKSNPLLVLRFLNVTAVSSKSVVSFPLDAVLVRRLEFVPHQIQQQFVLRRRSHRCFRFPQCWGNFHLRVPRQRLQ